MAHRNHGADPGSDSDFYGDEQTVALLHERVRKCSSLNNPEQSGSRVKQEDVQGNVQDVAMVDAQPQPEMHNPYRGVPYAWQLSESVDEFLSRLPPATTVQSEDNPWIYVCNPFVDRKRKAEAENQGIRGSENEGPEEDGSKTLLFEEGGRERLDLLTSFTDHASRRSQRGRRAPSQPQELAHERASATADILNLAWFLHVRCGKWMLFPDPAKVNEVWKTIVHATVNNELGISAKVAPRNPAEDEERPRLICIYTSDFRDTRDVARVLWHMRELGLVSALSRPIYYKCDAYTYLGIGSGNKWGIRPWLYSSTELFARIEAAE